MMNLYYTPRSHFSRKVRILLAALEIESTLTDVGNVAEVSDKTFGPNPLMKVPTLVDAESVIFESDHIAQYLVRQYDPRDRFAVLTCDVEELNARAVMNNIMSSEVELVLAERTGINIDTHLRFHKIRESINSSLAWLELNAEVFPNQPSYSGFHLVAAWDHLVLYNLVTLHYPKLAQYVRELSTLQYVASSNPH